MCVKVDLISQFNMFRYALFSLALARLWADGGSLTDCNTLLHSVKTVLDFYSRCDANRVVQPSMRSSTKRSLVKLSQNYMSQSQACPDNKDLVLQMRPMKLNLQSVKNCNLGSSPIHCQNAEFQIPDAWSHVVGCECQECNDLSLQLLWLMYLVSVATIQVKICL